MRLLITFLLACLVIPAFARESSPLPAPKHVKVNERVHVLLGPVGLDLLVSLASWNDDAIAL